MNTPVRITPNQPALPSVDSRNDRYDGWFVWYSRAKIWLIGAFALVIAALLYRTLQQFGQDFAYADLVTAMRGTTPAQHLLAGLATLLSYAALTGYDWSSLRYVGARVPYRTVAQTSFIAYALGNTIGVGVLTGGAVRMRIFGAAGAETGAISRAIVFNAIAFGCGLGSVGALAMLWDASAVASVVHLSAPMLRAMAGIVLGMVCVLLWYCRRAHVFRPFGFTVTLPGFRLAAGQLLISLVDIVAAALVLWALLPLPVAEIPTLVAFFAMATVLGVVSHVPGGLGVFETVLLIAFRDRLPVEQIAGALVLYRLYYYVLPLTFAVILLLIAEIRRGAAAPLQRAIISIAPLIIAGYTLVIGVVLLISGVTPSTTEVTELLALHVPLPLVEASHFIGSIGGLALLLVARGMLQRLDAAWWAGMALTLVGLVTAIFKGIVWSEAALLALLFGTLALARPQFTRRAALLAQPFSGGWLLSVTAILAGVSGILFFVYRDTAYTHELWWQFEFDAHAPRSLRAFVAVAVGALSLSLRAALRPRSERLDLPDQATLAKVDQIVRAQDSAAACLALMGDKHILFAETERAFIMFGRRGRSWIGLFDPIGPANEWPDLLWRFIEKARESDGRASFYQVRPKTLPLYLDAGLRVFKLGEEAYVPLADFSLQGKRRANLRHGVNRAEREGLRFELIPVERVPEMLPELRSISDTWLREHNTAEKRFSLGAFTDDYIRRQPIALVRDEARTIAFATIQCTERKTEVSIDLMRHVSNPPPGTMDILFAKLMLYCEEQGYERFGLGMAPLSGMAEHSLAPSWHRVGRLLYSHGEHFYNFRGLRAFKDKFAPEWEARYLAAPGGTTPLLVLTDIAALISGGIRGVFTK